MNYFTRVPKLEKIIHFVILSFPYATPPKVIFFSLILQMYVSNSPVQFN